MSRSTWTWRTPTDGVYLWGALVTDRVGTGLVERATGLRHVGARPAVTEVQLFERAVSVARPAGSTLRPAGLTVAVYCFHERAEAGAMRRLAASPRRRVGLDRFGRGAGGSPDWVDLLQVARRQLITGAAWA